jgi:tyrosine-protein kinase Etk/Wzc
MEPHNSMSVISPQDGLPVSADAPGSEPGTEALDFLIVIAKHKRMIAVVTLGAALLAVIISLLMPNVYTGKAVVMPPRQDQSAAALVIGQITGAVGGGGGNLTDALGLKSVNDLYIGLLKSRSIADRLIERFELQKLYGTATQVDTRRGLAKNSVFTAGKDGLMTIEFDDEDPRRAADIANAYVEELDTITRGLAITEASQRRLYYEKQLVQTKESLVKAEAQLMKVQQETGIIKLDEQARPIFEAISALRGQMAAKEIQIAGMRSFATDRNPELIRAREELAGMQKQLDMLQRNNAVGDGQILVPTGKVPELGLEYIRKLREVTYNDALFQALSKQYEIARIEEGKNASVIQSVDKAVVPDRKSKPARSLIVIFSAFIAGVLAVIAAFMIEKVGKLRQDSVAGERIRLLKEHARWKGA